MLLVRDDGEMLHRGSYRIGLLCGWLFLSCLACMTRPHVLSAQETESRWEVMPVLIPADPELQRQYIPRSYIPIEIEDLEVKLREEQQRRRNEQFLKPMLIDAFYVAKIDNGLLVADQVRWRFRGGPQTKPIKLGTVSAALRDARSVDGTRLEQLSTYQSFLPDGSLELRVAETQADRWLGLTASSTADEMGEQFSLRLPVAALATMLVSSRGNERIESDDVVVEEVERPSEHFPQDWPRDSVRESTMSGSRRWWLINLSGRQDFSLRLAKTLEDDHLMYQHSFGLAELDYLVGPRQLDVRAVWQLAATSLGAPLDIRLHESLRIKSVLLNGVAVEWRSLPSQLVGESRISVVDQPRLEPGTILQLEAVAEHPQGAEFELPLVQIARGWCIQGVSRVRGAIGVTIDSVESDGASCVPELSGSSAQPAQREVSWIHQWSGAVPALRARMASLQSQWDVDVLSRINVQAAWISANSRIQVTSNHLRSNELRLRVDPNWFIDNVQLLNGAEVDYRAQLLENNRDGELRSEIVISWEQERASIQLELEVMAHRPRDDTLDSVLLEHPQVVSVEDQPESIVDQTDTYVVESSGRFRVQPTASLLRFQRPARQLPVWQQVLLPQLTDAWIFTDRFGSMPTIRLAATGGTYAVDLYTLLAESEVDEEVSSIVYRATCRPVSGSVDRLKVHVPPSVSLEDLTFELLEPLDDGVVPLGVDEVGTGETYRELLVYFPTARTSPFKVRGRLKQPAGTPIAQVVTLGFPDATSIQSTLLLPEERGAFAGRPKLELLPANACCSDEDTWLFEEELKGAAPDKFAAARLDGAEAATITLQPARQRLAPGWIWSSTIDRYRWDDSSTKYVVRWDVETTSSSELKFLLPDNWRLDRVRINGEPANETLLTIPLSEQTETPVTDMTGYAAVLFQLSLPPNRRANVDLECSVDPQPGLTPVVDKLILELPRIVEMPIFDSSYRLHLAPSSIALSIGRPPAAGSGKLLDRLLPTAWWSMLAPHAEHVMADSGVEEMANGWSVVEWPTKQLGNVLQPGPAVDNRSLAQGMWVMRRSAMAACLTSLVVVLTALWWLVLSLSPRGWWLLMALSLIVCILLPREWVYWAQLLLLASGLALVVRLVTWIGVTRFATSKSQESRSPTRRSSLIGIGGCMLAWLVFPGSAALAQMPRPPTTGALSIQEVSGGGEDETLGQTSDDDDDAANGLYGVLFPVDQDSQIDGSYAYVPTGLWKLLSGSGAQEATDRAPRILSAAYLLRLRSGSVNAELSVDLRIQATREGGELRLPFRAEQLQLRGGQINGEERLVGLSGLRQESEYVAVQASKVGTFPVTLQFVTANTDSSMRLKASLPPVPNATLRIESDGMQVDVNAIGGVQSSGGGEILASLGPVAELDVSWRESSPRGFSSQGELASETWVHARGSQLMAACQLKFSPGQTVRPLLHVYIDSDWEPVGTSWGDAELLPNETMSFGNRRVYTVRMPKRSLYSASKVNLQQPEEATAAVIRLLLVPSNPTAMNAVNVPFILLQEQSANSRSLSWSTSSEGSSWKAEGIEFWQESFDAGSDWGELTLAPQRRKFKVPLGAAPLQIRRQNAAVLSTVDERTTLHYSLAGIAVDYNARWESRGAANALRLLLPKQSRIASLTVNGQAVDYRVSRHADGQWLLIPASGFRNSDVNALDLSMSLPAPLGQTTPLPRVVLRGLGIGSSRLVVYRGTRLDFEFDEQAAGELRKREISTSASLMLDSLEVMVGEFELGSDYRNGPALPFTATIGEAAVAKTDYAILFLNATSEGWMANVVAVWNPQASLDFAFFDVPSSTRNTLQAGSVARKFMPAADSSRATLCIVPSTTSTGQRIVRFSFPVPNASSGQALLVPRVQLLGETPQPLWLALPRRVDGANVEWAKTGNRLEADLLGQITEPGIGDFEVFASTLARTQIAWEAVAAETMKPLIVQKMVRVLKVDEHRTTAVISYWLLPRGELELEVGLPDDCRVLGVDMGGASAIWGPRGDHRLSVAIKPNYLPVNMQLLVEWLHAGDEEMGELELPMPLAEMTSDEWLVSMAEKSRWRLAAPRGQSLLPKAGTNAVWPAWVGLVRETVQAQVGKANEVALWMPHWEPRQLGIAYEQALDPAAVDIDPSWDEDNDGLVTAAEFWLSLGGVLAPTALQQAVVPPVNEPMYSLTQNRLAFTSTTLRESLVPRIAAATFIALAALLGLIVVHRIRNPFLALLATHPWLLWMKLGLLSLFLLPVLWPGLLVLGMSAILAISQWLSNRDRSRRLLV